MGSGLPLFIHRERAPHVVQRVWTTIQEEKEKMSFNIFLFNSCGPKLTHHREATTPSVWTRGGRSSPAPAGRGWGQGTAERWKLQRTPPYAEAASVEARFRGKRT